MVGFQGDAFCKDNNSYIINQAQRYPWAAPVAYVTPGELRSAADVAALADAGFVGASMYIFSDEDCAGVQAVGPDVWDEIERRKMLLSVNSKGASWGCWLPVLTRHPDLRVLVSHRLPTRATL